MFKIFGAEKSKFSIIPVCLVIIVILSLFSIFRTIKSYSYHFNIQGFNYPLESIKLTFELKERYHQGAYLVCYDDFCKTPSTNEFRSYYNSEFTPDEIEFHEKKVNKIYIAIDKSVKGAENINNIDINVGNRNIYLNHNDIKKLERNEFSIELKSVDGKKEVKKYDTIKIPNITNYRGHLSHLSNIILSLFYNWKFFIIPYIWLFVSCLLFIFFKDKFKFNLNLNKKSFYIILGGIILLGAFLRIVDITYFPLWTDEVYTKQVAIKDFISCFKDAGNPPLFFILEYIFTKIFTSSTLTVRILPCLFGLLFIFAAFILFKDIYKTKENKLPIFALFTGFMAAINTINIYHSQEARGYSLCMLLTILIIYSLFKYLEKPSNKRLTIFTILNILIINTNYYLILLSITNYVWGVVDLIQNKNKKEILKYTLSYVIAAITSIPYIIISSKEALSGGFNGWIPPLDHDILLYTINEFFINKYVFIALCLVVLLNLIILYFPKNLLEKINIRINPKKENLCLYLIYSLAFIIIIACFISLFIKPIFHKRVLLSIYSLLFMVEMITISSTVEFIKENKIIKTLKLSYFVILTVAYFSITSPMPVRQIYNINDFMAFLEKDSKQYDSNYEIHAIVTDNEDYIKEYPEVYNNKKIKFHYIDTNSGNVLTSIKKDDYITKGKRGVIYFNGIGVDVESISSFNPIIRVYRKNSALSAKLVY